MKPRTALRAGLAASLLFCASCQGVKPFYPVRGTVFLGEQPAEGALVVFHPADDSDPQALKPSARVQADGAFAVRCYDPQTCPTPRDGAPAGEYLVTVQLIPADYAEYRNVLPDKLRGRYSDPKTSGLRATVQAGSNELPPFRLDPPK